MGTTAKNNDSSESGGHWYNKDGSPCLEIVGKNGKARAPTLRDARPMGLVPSVTGIIRCAAAPGLEQWKRKQVLMSAMTLPRSVGQSEEDWMAAVERDAQEAGKKAAEIGTAIHAALEGRDLLGKYGEHVKNAMMAIEDYCPVTNPFEPEKSFSHHLGFGGKVDDYSVDGFVLDYKTTDKDLATIKTWDDHALQLAAYRQGLDMPDARCAIVYSHRDTGEAKLIELTEPELGRGWRMFRNLLNYWYEKTGLDRDKRHE